MREAIATITFALISTGLFMYDEECFIYFIAGVLIVFLIQLYVGGFIC